MPHIVVTVSVRHFFGLKMRVCLRSITEDVEQKVGKAMSEEIRRLSVMVDDFSDPFHPDPLVVNVYRSRLNHHIENGIGSNLKNRLSTDLQLNVESHEQVNPIKSYWLVCAPHYHPFNSVLRILNAQKLFNL